MNISKIYESRSRRRIFIGLVCLILLLAVLWGFFRLWNIPPHPTLTMPQSNANPTIPNWKLIFDDEFNDTSLDPKKWNIEDMSIGGYHECCLTYGVQYYTPQALSLQQGSLRITTQKQNVSGYNYKLTAAATYNYTSGAITTEHLFSFTYGRVDIRARLPKTQGFWPALWLLPPDSVAVAPYEIDMMELLGQDPTTVYMTNHWGTQQNGQAFTGPDFSQDYHVFSIIWTSKSISWYIDGVQRFESEQGIPNQSMYLIINSSLGGHWPGYPDASTVLPQYMDIDYARVYQPAAGNTTSTSH